MVLGWDSLRRWATGKSKKTTKPKWPSPSPSFSAGQRSSSSRPNRPCHSSFSSYSSSTPPPPRTTPKNLGIYTQGIEETLACARDSSSPEAVLALRRLQREAEKRARSGRGGADELLRELSAWREEEAAAAAVQLACDPPSFTGGSRRVHVFSPNGRGDTTRDTPGEGLRWVPPPPSSTSFSELAGTDLGLGRCLTTRTVVAPPAPSSTRETTAEARSSSRDSAVGLNPSAADPLPESGDLSLRGSDYVPQYGDFLDLYDNEDEDDSTTPDESPRDQDPDPEIEEAEVVLLQKGAARLVIITRSAKRLQDVDTHDEVAAPVQQIVDLAVDIPTLFVTAPDEEETQDNDTHTTQSPISESSSDDIRNEGEDPEFSPVSEVSQDTTVDDDVPNQYYDSDSDSDMTYDGDYSSSDDELLTPLQRPLLLTQGIDIPPFLPYAPNAQAPLAVIRAGLSLPAGTPYAAVQCHIARNVTMLRYLGLHLVPEPSASRREHASDLREPVLSCAVREADHTRLLQAMRTVYWDAPLIRDALFFVDSLVHRGAVPPCALRRRHDELRVFRKLFVDDARRKGYLTASQHAALDARGFSLVEVLGIKDLPHIVTRGFAGALVRAAEEGSLGVARGCGMFAAEGPLLAMVREVANSRGGGARRGREKGSGRLPSRLRECVSAEEAALEEEEKKARDAWWDREFEELEAAAKGEPEGMSAEKLDELEAFFKNIQSTPPQSPIRSPPGFGDRRPSLARSPGSFMADDADGSRVMVDEETIDTAELQHLIQEDDGLTPSVVEVEDVDSREPQQARPTEERRSWGVDLGGILES